MEVVAFCILERHALRLRHVVVAVVVVVVAAVVGGGAVAAVAAVAVVVIIVVVVVAVVAFVVLSLFFLAETCRDPTYNPMLEASDPNGTSTPTQGHNGRKELRDQRGVRVIGVKTSVLVGELDIHGMLRQYVTITNKRNQKNVVYIAKPLKRLRTRPSGVVSHHRMGARTTPQFVGISLVLDVLVSWFLLISFDGMVTRGKKMVKYLLPLLAATCFCFPGAQGQPFKELLSSLNGGHSDGQSSWWVTESNPKDAFHLVMFQEIRDFVPHACFLKLLPPKNRWSFFSIS